MRMDRDEPKGRQGVIISDKKNGSGMRWKIKRWGEEGRKRG